MALKVKLLSLKKVLKTVTESRKLRSCTNSMGVFLLVTFASHSHASTGCQQRPKPITVGIIKINDELLCKKTLLQQLTTLCDDSSVRGILLIISSGGGSATTSEHVAQKIKACRTHKPVIALIIEMCLSGAYWIAAATDYIVAAPTSLIGSIGTRHETSTASHEVLSLDEKILSLSTTVLKSGNYSAQSNELLENTSKDAYEDFIKEIIAYRPLVKEKTEHQWADGRMFVGRRALDMHLIDKLGSMTEAVDALIALLHDRGISTRNELIEFKEP
jgi:protease IV